MKKIILYITILLLALTKVASSQVATISTVDGTYGDMQVAVNLTDFTATHAIGALQMKIGFDPSVVSFTGITHNLIASGIVANAVGNEITITWTTNTSALEVNGIGFLLNFNYTGGSCNLSDNWIETADGLGTIFTTTFLSGAINQPTVNTVATINTQPGDYYGINEVPISFVTSPIPLPTYLAGAIDLNIGYNDTKLQFLGIDGLPGATANASNGVITIAWSGTGANTVDLNTLNLRLKFNYLGGVSTLSFSGTNIISNPTGGQIPVAFNPGAVTQPATSAAVTIGTSVGNPGGTTSVPVVFSGFPVNQGAVTMNIAYNNSALNFTGTTGLSGLTANASNGIITLTWVNYAGSMISGFDLLFNYLGGSSNLDFTGTNEISNAAGIIPTTFSNGNVTQSSTTVTVSLGNTALTPGSSNVLVPVNFSGVSGNVNATTMYINFDNTKLTYTGFENATAGAVVNQDLATNTIIITWSNTNTSITDGKFLDLKFTFTGGAGNCDVPVYFTSFNSNMSSFADAIGTTVIANLVNGNVNTLPSVYNVTGGGHYCAGGTGVLVGLDGSQTGVSYQLKLNGTDVGTAYTGTGFAIDFGFKTVAGNYTVLAYVGSGTSCTNMMGGSATVVIDALPNVEAGLYGPACSNSAAITLVGSPTGGVWSGTGVSGNSFDPSVGTQTLTYTYTDGNTCVNSSTTTITVTPLPTATISYTGSPWCITAAAQTVTLTGATGGVFSSTTGLFIDASTGEITPASSTAGTYTVTYTIAAAGGCSAVTATAEVTITAMPTASISYAGTPFCTSVTTPQAVTLTGTAGGVYSSTTGLSFDEVTGAITPELSNAGTYTVTYIIAAAGGCSAVTATTSVTVTTLPVATISYSGTPYCSSVTTAQAVTFTGTTGGVYSSTTGLSFDEVTGAIIPELSNEGTYTVTYTIAAAGGCAAVTATTSVTITALPTAVISYSNAAYCTSVPVQSVILAGTTGGVYSSTSGLTISSSTGAITPGTSTAGTYIVTYTIAAAGGCSAVTATTSVTINTLPTVTANSTAPSVCFGSTVTLTGSGAVSYTWDNSVIDNVAFTPIYTKTYTVTGTDANGCQNTATVGVVVKTIPTVTATVPASRCGIGTVSLGATPSAGTINWYEDLSGGILLSTGNTYTPTIDETTTFYVAATSNGCTTATRTAVLATMNVIPTITLTTPATRCGTGTVNLGATASAGTINWYADLTGGVSLGSGISYSPSVSATTTFYVDATANGCTTATRTAVLATVNTIPTITGTTPATICGTGIATLSATASAGTIQWYAGLTGGSILYSGNTFTPSVSATTTYYAEATDNGCTTLTRTAVTATVNAIPTITATVPASRCGDGIVTLSATASAGSVNWYTDLTGGSLLYSGTYYTPTITSTTTYYAEATANGCTSATRTAVTATINQIPEITGTTSDTRCGTGIVTLSATAATGTINWYADLSGGSVLYTGAVYTPIVSVTTTYFADVTENGCTSTPRIAVTATINAIPAITGTTSAALCGTGIANLAATASDGTINWYTDVTAGSLVATGTTYSPSVSVTTTYYVDATENGCTTATRTAITATVNPIPAVVANATATTVCSGTSVTLTGSGTSGVTYTWNNSVINGVVFNPTTTLTYTVTGTVTLTGCQNTAAVTVTVNPAPPVNPIVGAAILCAGTLNSAYSIAVNTFGQPLPTGNGHGTGSDQTSGAVNDCLWSYGGTGASFSSTTGNAVTISFGTSATSGTLTVVETDPSSGCSTTNTLAITVNPLPTAQAGGNSTITTAQNAYVIGGDATGGTVLWTHNGLGTLTNANTLNFMYTPAIGDAGNAVVLTLTVTSPFGCIAIDTCIVNVIPSTFSVSGILKYANTSGPVRPITNTTINLKSGATIIATSTTDVNGNFTLTGIPNGTYTYEIGCYKPWSISAITLADYSIIKSYVNNGTPSLTGIYLKAADVNNSNTITLADYSIVKNTVNTSSLSGWNFSSNWIFNSPSSITITGANVNGIIILGILRGDVNSSYTPSLY